MLIRLMTVEDIPEVSLLHENLFSQAFNFIDYAVQQDFYYGIVIEVDLSLIHI